MYRKNANAFAELWRTGIDRYNTSGESSVVGATAIVAVVVVATVTATTTAAARCSSYFA